MTSPSRPIIRDICAEDERLPAPSKAKSCKTKNSSFAVLISGISSNSPLTINKPANPPNSCSATKPWR